MVVVFSWHRLLKKIKLYIKIMLLFIIILYILPKLLTLFWHTQNPDIKIRDQNLMEKPLRVFMGWLT